MLKSLDSILLYVADPKKSAEFYRALGFEVTEAEDYSIAKLNWFTIRCQDKNKVKFTEESNVEPKGAGVYIYIQVENIDAYYKSLNAKNLKPSSEPRDWPWGNREFVIRDPDRYKLVFYQSAISKKV